jgi:hypothetical protein
LLLAIHVALYLVLRVGFACGLALLGRLLVLDPRSLFMVPCPVKALMVARAHANFLPNVHPTAMRHAERVLLHAERLAFRLLGSSFSLSLFCFLAARLVAGVPLVRSLGHTMALSGPSLAVIGHPTFAASG